MSPDRQDSVRESLMPEPSPESQSVVTPLTEAAIFLVVTVNPGGEEAVRGLLADVTGICRAVGFRIPDGSLDCVTGIGSQAWGRLFAGPRPAELHPFRELAGPRHRAPATPGDLLFHVRANRMDLCFEFAAQVMARLAGAVTVADEVHGFRYFDERDLIGFVDGTESPGGRAGLRAAIIGDQDPGFAGGSYVIVQKYLHDMASWNALPIEEQERVIGRRKLTDIELADEDKPANSHVALNTLTGPDGEELQIVRANMPFGDVGRGEFGTYFIGYAASVAITEQMLENMFIGRPPGNTDRVLDFSTAVTGGLFFAPSADFLDDLPAVPDANTLPAANTVPGTVAPDTVARAATAAAPATATVAPATGSLGIGSLKGRP
jgi:porphyrinogen peroxidase